MDNNEQQGSETVLTEEDMAVIEEINNENVEEEQDVIDDEVSVDDPEDLHEDEEQQEGEEFNEDLLRAADAFGIDSSNYRSEEQLRGAIEASKNFTGMMQQQQQQAQQMPEYQTYQSPQFKFDLGEDVDPELQERFNQGLQSVVDHFSQQQELLAQYVLQQQQTLDNSYYSQEADRVFDEWDSAVQNLGREDRFGRGGYNELSSNQHRTEREKLGQQVTILLNGYSAQGIEPPSMEDLVKQADAMLNASDFKKQAREEISEKIRAQSRRTTKTGSRSQRRETTPDDPVDNPTLIEWWENNVQ